MKISRIDIVGSNGNDGEHYLEMEAKARAFDAYIAAAGKSNDIGMLSAAITLNAVFSAEMVRAQSGKQYTDPTNYFGEDLV